MHWASSMLGNILAIIVAVAVGGTLAFVSAKYVDLGRASNNGFGPDWQCSRPAMGDPICVRRR
jgi:hypothetical protein